MDQQSAAEAFAFLILLEHTTATLNLSVGLKGIRSME